MAKIRHKTVSKRNPRKTATCLFFPHQRSQLQLVRLVCPPNLGLRVRGYGPKGRGSLSCLPEGLLMVLVKNSLGTGCGGLFITPHLPACQSNSSLKHIMFLHLAFKAYYWKSEMCPSRTSVTNRDWHPRLVKGNVIRVLQNLPSYMAQLLLGKVFTPST